MIPYGKQDINRRDIKQVIKILKSDFLTTGPKVEDFEKKFAEYVGAKYAVAVSNGTAALHLSCLSVGLENGDEIITTPITFAASANCALYCNSKPIFADITSKGIIDPKEIEKKISKKTKAIIPVHYTGLPCDMEEIKKIAIKNNLMIIEDGCHALGSRYKDSKIGDCKYSDMCVFSFHPVKHITTGEGGIITTNSKKTYEKLKRLRNHGISKETKKSKELPWYYEMIDLGFNYRITDFQCALGENQLKRVGDFIRIRRDISNAYDKFFKRIPNIETIDEGRDKFNSHHLYLILLKNEKVRLNLFKYLKNNDISCQIHYIPVYWHPHYKRLGYKKGECPEAEKFYSRIISIPIYPSLRRFEQRKVMKKIKEFFKKNGR